MNVNISYQANHLRMWTRHAIITYTNTAYGKKKSQLFWKEIEDKFMSYLSSVSLKNKAYNYWRGWMVTIFFLFRKWDILTNVQHYVLEIW